MSEKVWVGIDVGAAGGLAVLTHESVSVWDMPALERGGIDGQGFRVIMQTIKDRRNDCVIVLERLNGFGSPQSGFNLGRASGIVEGIFSGFGFEDIRYVDPVTWKSKLKLRGRGKTKEIAKQMSVDLACSLFPAVRNQIAHDGIADALLLAHYAREYLSDENQADNVRLN